MDDSKKCNDLSGKEWLQNSFSIWRDLSKSNEEKVSCAGINGSVFQ